MYLSGGSEEDSTADYLLKTFYPLGIERESLIQEDEVILGLDNAPAAGQGGTPQGAGGHQRRNESGDTYSRIQKAAKRLVENMNVLGYSAKNYVQIRQDLRALAEERSEHEAEMQNARRVVAHLVTKVFECAKKLMVDQGPQEKGLIEQFNEFYEKDILGETAELLGAEDEEEGIEDGQWKHPLMDVLREGRGLLKERIVEFLQERELQMSKESLSSKGSLMRTQQNRNITSEGSANSNSS